MVCSVAKISGKRGRYYLNHYYNEELGEKGFYAGSGAKHFGIENQFIDHKDYRLENLLDGKSPDGMEQLKRGGNTERIYKDKLTGKKKAYKKLSAFDFCLSDPKALSVLDHLANNGEVSNEVERCRNLAQQAAIEYISNFCQIRKKTYDENKKEVYTYHKAAPTFAVFQHHLSREKDPQSHRHLLLMSGATSLNDPDIKGSLDTREFFKMRYTVGQIYLNTLRHELETGILKLKTFDIPFKEEKGKSFGIKGVPVSLCRALSKRSQQIEENITPEMSGKEVQKVVLQTRKTKEKVKGKDDIAKLQENWEVEGKKHGFKLSKICPVLYKKSQVINLKEHLEAKQKEVNEIKHYAAITRILRQKDDVTFHQIMTASLSAGGTKLSSEKAQEYAQKFISHYTTAREAGNKKYGTTERYRLRSEAYRLPESCLTITEKTAHAIRTLINWQQQNRKNVKEKYYNKAEKRSKLFERRALGLYLTGRINRIQYLACKRHSPLEGNRFKLELYHAFHLISTKQKNQLIAMGEVRQSQFYAIKMALKEGKISQHMANVLLKEEWEKATKKREQEATDKRLKTIAKKERNKERIEKVRRVMGRSR